MNRYDTPALAEFINTYVPVPFEELFNIGKELNARRDAADKAYRETMADWKKFYSPSKVDVLNWAESTYESDAAKEIIDRYLTDPNYVKTAEGQAALANLANTANIGNMQMLQMNALNLSTYQKNRAELEAKGLYNADWDDVDVANYDTLGSGMLSQLSPLEYRSVVDIVKPFVDNLNGSYLGKDAQFLYNGVSKLRTRDQVDQNLSSILNQPFAAKHIAAIKKNNPGMTDALATLEFMRQAYTAAEEFSWVKREVNPIYLAQLRNNNSRRLRNGGSDASDGFVQTWMSRHGKTSNDTFVSNFNEFASDEYKLLAADRRQLQQEEVDKLREEYQDAMTIAGDFVSSPEAKKTAEQDVGRIQARLQLMDELNELEDKHAIVIGALSKWAPYGFFDPNNVLWTGNYQDQSKKPFLVIHSTSAGAPYIQVVTPDGVHKEVRARENGNIFDLNSKKYNKGWFGDENTYSDSEVDYLFNRVAQQVMIPSELGDIEPVENYLFGERKDYAGTDGYSLPSDFVIKSTAKFLGEYDPLLKKQAREAGIDLDELQREDYQIPQWLNTKISGAMVNKITGLNFSQDDHGRTQVDIMMSVDVPLSEIERLSNKWWGDEDELRELGFRIINDAQADEGESKKYVRVPVVTTRPYDVNFSSYVNPTYQNLVHMPASTISDSEELRSYLEYMRYGISPNDQYNEDGK